MGDGSTEVAGGAGEPRPRRGATTPRRPAGLPAESGETISMFGASVVELVANKQPWRTIDCSLAPKGWTAETPIAADRVVLSQPECGPRTPPPSWCCRRRRQARSLQAVRVTDAGGKAFHIGTLTAALTGQVKLADQWLLVQLPTGTGLERRRPAPLHGLLRRQLGAPELAHTPRSG